MKTTKTKKQKKQYYCTCPACEYVFELESKRELSEMIAKFNTNMIMAMIKDGRLLIVPK